MGETTNQLDKIKDQLEEMLKNMKFGSITLIVQDGKVIQIEKSEKIRLSK
ncbi:YezD family protein [Niallia taxi]